MLRDARTLGQGAELSADICIAGAGAAGITLARRLSGQGLRVLLLEAGSFEIDAAHQALYAGTMSGLDTWRLDEQRLRMFGGSTGHWGGWCMPLLPSDFRAREHINESGWPITFDDLEPYYRIAQVDLQLAGFQYDAEAVAAAGDFPLIEGTGALTTHLFQFSPPTRMGDRYRAELDAADDVDVYMWANVTEVVLDDALAQVDHLVCRTLSGIDFTVVADRYVLAMGGLENARLLLASAGQLSEGVANSSGLVGKYFMEHPHLYQAAMWSEPGVVDARFYSRHRATITADGSTREIAARGALALSEEVRERERLPHLTVTVLEVPLDAAHTGPIPPATAVALERSPGTGVRALGLTVRAEQTPTIDSALSLTRDRDALGLPRIDLHWTVSESDLIAYARAMEILGSELAAAGLGRVWTPVDERGRFDTPISPGGHHMGTLRMHADPARGVVDANARAHDLANLYVAGSAVFTTVGASNPTLTLVALAERLAAHLLAEGQPP